MKNIYCYLWEISYLTCKSEPVTKEAWMFIGKGNLGVFICKGNHKFDGQGKVGDLVPRG